MTEPHWKERLRARYAALKRAGRPFFPYAIWKDTLAVFLLFLILVGLAVWQGAELEGMADPTDTTYNPRPEWYFLFLFQALKFFPGSMEAVAAIILPSIALLVLVLLPFLDRGPHRHPWDRRGWTVLGIVACLGFSALTILGLRSPLLNPVVEKNPAVAFGRQLYRELRCNYCHSIDGEGGVAAPDLSTVGARRDREWMLRHFEDPAHVMPGSIMPRLNLLPEEAQQLTTYLQTLGGEGPFTAEAKPLFETHCSACHTVDGAGGDMGPDLSTIRSYRDKAYIYEYIRQPITMNATATMPGFEGTLTDAQIEDLARYLASALRNPTP